MILEQISVIIKMFILGIFIAIMFDNISRYCNYVFSFVLWCPIIYLICRVMINITNLYEITYIIYYIVIYMFAYYVYYRFMKSKLNNTIDIIIKHIRYNSKIKKIINLMFFMDGIKFLKKEIKIIFKKIKVKRKKSKKDLKNI